jgi:hypothetical protein
MQIDTSWSWMCLLEVHLIHTCLKFGLMEQAQKVFERLPMRDVVLLNANSVHFSALLLDVHNVRKELAFTYKRIIVVHNLK